MKRMSTTAVVLSMLMTVGSALAQTTPMIGGVVTKVNESAEKITIKHEPIPNLDMGEMTMVFRAADKAMLKQVKKGDKIRFTAERVNGQITVTSIGKAK
jgi:Cu(I)/Ag(I) efflux system protein CusF